MKLSSMYLFRRPAVLISYKWKFETQKQAYGFSFQTIGIEANELRGRGFDIHQGNVYFVLDDTV
jgi:hypothetical protein